jgi:hypothetical protein
LGPAKMKVNPEPMAATPPVERAGCATTILGALTSAEIAVAYGAISAGHRLLSPHPSPADGDERTAWSVAALAAAYAYSNFAGKSKARSTVVALIAVVVLTALGVHLALPGPRDAASDLIMVAATTCACAGLLLTAAGRTGCNREINPGLIFPLASLGLCCVASAALWTETAHMTAGNDLRCFTWPLAALAILAWSMAMDCGAGALVSRILLGGDQELDSRNGGERSRRWLFIGLSLVIFGIVTLGWSYLTMHVEQVRGETAIQLGQIATLKTDELNNWIFERKGDIRTCLATPWVRKLIAEANAGGAPRESGMVSDLLEGARAAYGYERIVLYSRQLTPVLVTGTGDGALPTPTVDDLKEALYSARETLIDTPRPTGRGSQRLRFIAPVRSNAGDVFEGAVEFAVDPEKSLFQMVRKPAASGAEVQTVLLKATDASVLNLSSGPSAMPTAENSAGPAGEPFLEALAARQQDSVPFVGLNRRGIRSVGVARRVPGTTWVLLVHMTLDDAFKSMRHEAFHVFTGLSGIITAMGLGTGYIWRIRRERLMVRSLHVERDRAEAARS